MDILAKEHVILFFSSWMLLLASPCTSSVDDLLPRILSCRASCIDKFCNGSRDEVRCRTVNDCKMCWDACDLLHNSFDIWGPMCTIQEICLPGCQQACRTFDPRNSTEATNHNMTIHTIYDPQTDQVLLKWKFPQEDLKKGTTLYAVLHMDPGVLKDNKWNQIIQTTTHATWVRRGMLNRDTLIRIVGANAFGQITDVKTSYFDSLIEQNKYAGMENHQKRENYNPIHFIGSGTLRWRPQLFSLSHPAKSMGVHATVTWSPLGNSKDVKYEVSWNVIDDTIEITGHLHTISHTAVLTLWPDALYAVQVTALVDWNIKKKSEPLLIDTRIDEPKATASPNKSCIEFAGEYELFINCIAAALFFLLLSAICFAFSRFKCGRELRNKKAEELHAGTLPSAGKLSIIHNVNLQENPETTVQMEPHDKLAKVTLHKIPTYFLNQPSGTQLDIENHYSSGNSQCC